MATTKTTNFSKLSTENLKKRLTTAKGDDKKTIKDLIAKREGQTPKKEIKVKFTTRGTEKKEISGVVTSIVQDKAGNDYYGVKVDGKTYYKKATAVTKL